jgi:hypothetical protein
MKYLMLVLLGLGVVGCGWRLDEKSGGMPEPKFHFRQNVTVINGFYSGYKGRVVDHYVCAYDGDNGDYRAVWCYSIGENDRVGVREEDLR